MGPEAPFERYLRDEAKRAEILVARTRVIAAGGLLLVPLVSLPFVTPQERSANVMIAVFMFIGTLYAVGIEILARRGYGAWLTYLATAIDLAIVTGGALVVAAGAGISRTR